jgi:hypothetical protein
VHNIVYGNFTFAVTTVKENGDLYIHIEAPAENSWVAVGTGSEMKGSLMWVVYRSEDEKGTLRLTLKRSRLAFTSTIT